MKVVSTYLLAVLGGSASPSADDIRSILASIGAEADEEKIELLLSQVTDRDIIELIATGRQKLSSVPGGDGDAVAVAGGDAVPTAAAPTAEAKKEEKVEEKEESDDDAMFSL